jgi:hypothetical protein
MCSGRTTERTMAKKAAAKKPKSPKIVTAEIRSELRSIIRQWERLRQPLRNDRVVDERHDQPRFQIEALNSLEELPEHVTRFAGSVWQLKDRFKQYVDAHGLQLAIIDAIGRQKRTTIEDEAEKSTPLMLCADLYNYKKHGGHSNRSGYDPILHGIQTDTSKSGVLGLYINSATQTSNIRTSHSAPVPYRIEIRSRDGRHSFGDALVVILRGFAFWFPFIRQHGVLTPIDEESQDILGGMARIEEHLRTASPFKPRTSFVTDNSGRKGPNR